MRQAQSFGSVKIISLDRADLLARLHRIAEQIRQDHADVQEIRLFGSLARGDATGTSDADVLIILRKSSDPDPHRRILHFLRYFTLDRGTDLLVYTGAEFQEQLAVRNPFVQRIWRESIAL